MAIMILLLCCAVNPNSLKPQSPKITESSQKSPQSRLDGVYEFVSEITTVTWPSTKEIKLTSYEWKGTWFFQDGRFSKTMMKIERPEWTPGKFPIDTDGTGFDGASGTYTTENNSLKLDYILSFYPGKVYQQDVLTFDVESETLTLTRKLIPNRESQSSGECVTVLRRVSKDG